MRVVIVGNGTIKDTSFITKVIKSDDIVICCDGGIKHLFAEGILPKYIIGDLDSSPAPMIQFFESKGVLFKKFPVKKDETDMELCIDFVISLNIEEIVILGATGTRLDHTLANIGLLLKPLEKGIKACILDEHNEIYLINQKIEILGNIGDNISLIPFSKKVEKITTSGLEYSLNKDDMFWGKSLGISNVMTENKACINIEKGELLIFKSID